MIEGKKVVITGGAGFIGSYIAERLVERGCNVVIIDNLYTGTLANIANIVSNKSVTFVKGDIFNLGLLEKVFRGADFVFHHAAITNIPYGTRFPKLAHEVNATGTLNVLIAARDCAVKKVIYASSSAVYGEDSLLNERMKKTENLPPCPMTPYAVSKLAGEYYGGVFQRMYGLRFVGLRYFNVYGERQGIFSEYAAVIPSFVSWIESGQKPVINGDGKQSRDFIYVSDVVDANILAAESEMRGAFNIGTSKGTTVNKLVRLIMEIYGNNIEPLDAQERQGDVRYCVADISKVEEYGFKPKYSLGGGLKKIIKAEGG